MKKLVLDYLLGSNKETEKVCFRSKGNSHRFSVSSFSLPCFQIRDQVTSSVKIYSPLKNYNYFCSLLQTFLTQSSHDILVLCSIIRASIMLGEKRKPFSRSQFTVVGLNPLSPSIHVQILQTDLYTFPSRISRENLIIDQGIFSCVIILLLLITSLGSVWILFGEI